MEKLNKCGLGNGKASLNYGVSTGVLWVPDSKIIDSIFNLVKKPILRPLSRRTSLENMGTRFYHVIPNPAINNSLNLHSLHLLKDLHSILKKAEDYINNCQKQHLFFN